MNNLTSLRCLLTFLLLVTALAGCSDHDYDHDEASDHSHHDSHSAAGTDHPHDPATDSDHPHDDHADAPATEAYYQDSEGPGNETAQDAATPSQDDTHDHKDGDDQHTH